MLVTATKQWPFYFSRNTIYDSEGSVTKTTANRTKPVDAAGSPTLPPKEIVKTPVRTAASAGKFANCDFGKRLNRSRKNLRAQRSPSSRAPAPSDPSDHVTLT